MQDTILVFCAHSDDEIFGMGGTIANYIKDDKKVVTIIFSKGEKSVPWLNEKYLANLRKKEAHKINDEIGQREIIFLELKDFELVRQIEKENIKERIKKIILKYKPVKIFTHSPDYHLDHRTVFKTMLEVVDSLDKRYPVYTFDVWKMIDAPQNMPKLYINITKTFSSKINALKQFKSQLLFSIYPLMPSMYFKAIYNGYKNKCKYAELFYKVR